MADVLDTVHVGPVRALEEPDARNATLSGSKAAGLAVARRHGLPVVPGFVVTTHAHALYLSAGRVLPPELVSTLREAWGAFTGDGRTPVVVRSSSTVEDVAASSMAGRFRTVLDVRGWDAFLDAVRAVYASADAVGAGPSPMGVLVQEHILPTRSGVMFGIDPVTGDATHVVVEAVSGGPDRLVSGQVSAQHYVVGRGGRLRALDHHPVRGLGQLPRGRLLDAADLVSLARLARRTQKVFGVAQDVEWAVDSRGSLLLLQSRPVTATAAVAPDDGPVLGPGPLAETFPDPLSELETDLWIEPLRAAVTDAMTETGAVSRQRLEGSPVVAVVGGRVAADLELFGYVPSRSASAWRKAVGWLDPRPALRQLRAAWRIGVLRAELPAQVAALVSSVDASLSAVEPTACDEQELVDLLGEGVGMLRRLHRAEVLAGTLLRSRQDDGVTAAGLALRALAAEPDLSYAELVHRHPVVLCLTPPSLAGDLVLPPPPATPAGAGPPDPGERLGEREQLRLRARWVQEMTARVAAELGRRLVGRGRLDDPRDIALVHLGELPEVTTGARWHESLTARRTRDLAVAFEPPLPAQFRLGGDGSVVPVARPGARPGSGTPAGGGRGVGPACHGSVRRPPSPGDVLVVRDLQPGLAVWLPGLGGLVAETGGTLSHLAILARENGVPTVVAVHDALRRFPPGARLLVDGSTGEVREVGGAGQP